MHNIVWRDDLMTGESYYYCESYVAGRLFCQEMWTVPERTEKTVWLGDGIGKRIRLVEIDELTNETNPDGSYFTVEKQYDNRRRTHMFHVSRGWFKER